MFRILSELFWIKSYIICSRHARKHQPVRVLCFSSPLKIWCNRFRYKKIFKLGKEVRRPERPGRNPRPVHLRRTVDEQLERTQLIPLPPRWVVPPDALLRFPGDTRSLSPESSPRLIVVTYLGTNYEKFPSLNRYGDPFNLLKCLWVPKNFKDFTFILLYEVSEGTRKSLYCYFTDVI